MRHLLLIALLLAAGPTMARSGGEGNNTGCQGRGNPNSPCVPTTNNPRPQQQTQSQTQAQRQAQRQQQVARGGNARATGGNARQSSQQTVTQSGGSYTEQRQVPSVVVGSAIPPLCGAGFSGGAANQNGTGVLGASWETESCRKDRLAARLAALGRTDAAVNLLCTMDEVREAFAATSTPCPSAQPVSASREMPAPVNTSGLSDAECRTLRERGMIVRGCP